jgi:hypothetical protein
MKLTRKIESLGKALAMPDDKDGEIAPGLHISQLPSPLEGIPDKGDFQAHIKGKVKRHSVTTEGGKSHHSYDLDVHHLEPHGKVAPKQRKSTREGVDEAFEKYGPKEAPPAPPPKGKAAPPPLPKSKK